MPEPDTTKEPEANEDDTTDGSGDGDARKDTEGTAQTEEEPKDSQPGEDSDTAEKPSENPDGANAAGTPEGEEPTEPDGDKPAEPEDSSAPEETAPTQGKASGKTISDIDKDNNVKVRVLGISGVTFSGDGTAANPYYSENKYESGSKDKVTIQTANPQASINGGANSLVINLAYGDNTPAFTVTSADGTKTAHYKMLIVRNKAQRSRDYLDEGYFSISPVTAAGNDGKIMGLNPDEYYDYRLATDSNWRHINGAGEITGLTPGTYQLKFGESPEYKAGSFIRSIEVVTEGPLPITIYAGAPEIIIPAEATPGQRVNFKVKMNSADQLLETIVWEAEKKVDKWTIYEQLSTYPLGYETDQGNRYFTGYFIMPKYPVRLNNARFLTENYYTLSYETIPNIAVTLNPPKSTVIYQTPYFKEDTSVTINVQQSLILTKPGQKHWIIVKSYKVCDESGNIVAQSTDGSDITVTMTGNFTLQDIEYETLRPDLTAAKEQLRRLDGVDLYDYTDDTRIPVQEILDLVPLLDTLVASQSNEQYLNNIVAQLKQAIDALEPKPGDFTKANEVLKEVPQDMSIYTDETAKAVQAAKEALEKAIAEKWDRTRQTETDDLTKALEEALADLKKKPADQSKAEAAKNNVPDDLSVYTDESVKKLQDALDTLNALMPNSDITQQDALDQAAADVEAAIQALEKKPEPTATPEPTTTPEPTVTPEPTATPAPTAAPSSKNVTPPPKSTDAKATQTVKTADTSAPGLWTAALAVSSIVIIGLYMLIRKKRSSK